MQPIIAMPQMGNDLFRKYMKSKYVQSLARAGAVVRWIDGQDPQKAAREAAACDGLLLPGGADIAPERYGQTPTENSGKPNAIRDEAEWQMLAAFLDTGKPVFAICRGMQFVNVFFGGTLFQDIKEKQQYRHMDFFSRASSCHPVSIEPNSLLYRLWQTEKTEVNSMHHQAIDTLGKGLRISAKSGDGFAEAIETPEYPFLLGVQWHPEHMSRKSEQQQRLFDAFVRECANR